MSLCDKEESDRNRIQLDEIQLRSSGYIGGGVAVAEVTVQTRAYLLWMRDPTSLSGRCKP